ncbi:Synaptotagmin-3-like protein [Drosera capensis]
MGFVSTLCGILGFGIGLPLGLLLGFFFFVYSKPHVIKDPFVRPIQEMDKETLQELMQEMPHWIKSPDYERVDWLNKFISEMWPYLDKAICETIRSTAKSIFSEYIGMYQIQEIEFEELNLGTLPPTFHGMKVYDTNENELVMEPAMKWAGNPNIVLVVKLLSLRIRFQPHVDFGFNILGADIMSIPGLYQFVQKTIEKQIANLYHWPQFLEVPILSKSTSKKPVGVLHVKVVRALKLLKMDVLGASDPYVKLSLTGEKLPAKKTSIKMRNLNPEWNESFKLIVKDPETQVLELQVYDWDKVGGHDRLGMQRVPLKQLIPQETKEFTLDLLKSSNLSDAHTKKPRGKLVVELTFDPFKYDNTSFKSFDDKLAKKESIGGCTSFNASLSEAGVLLVTVISAEEVEGEHHTNPYCQILFKGEKKKTKMLRKTRNPRWNEEFQFMMDEPPMNEKIRIEVLSKRRLLAFWRKDGNQSFPVCRAEWKEVPIQGPRTDPASGKARNRNTVSWRPQHDTIITVIRRLPSSRPNFYQNGMSPSEVTEPAQFDDDEPLNQQELMKFNASVSSDPPSDPTKTIDIRTYLET